MTDDDRWLNDNLSKFKALGQAVDALLSNVLTQRKIEFLSISHRTKSRDNILEKSKRKGYGSIRDKMTDIAGIRVVTYLESGVEAAVAVIRDLFEIDEENSHDKSKTLGKDRVGYRSQHFVCTLSEERRSLPEFIGFGELRFEIQVRTVLQHSWAEFSHDRNYKFSEVLSPEIERRLHLCAGLLELADQTFDSIAIEIDNFKEQVAEETAAGNLELELTTASLYEYSRKFANDNGITFEEEGPGQLDGLIEELHRFGVTNIRGVHQMFSHSYKEAVKTHQTKVTLWGLLRGAMMFADMDKYFEQSWGNSWTVIRARDVDELGEKYSKESVYRKLNEYGIEVRH